MLAPRSLKPAVEARWVPSCGDTRDDDCSGAGDISARTLTIEARWADAGSGVAWTPVVEAQWVASCGDVEGDGGGGVGGDRGSRMPVVEGQLITATLGKAVAAELGIEAPRHWH